jgi:hypothetical protein
MVAFPGLVATQPENRLGGTALKLCGKDVCARGLRTEIQPLSVKFCPMRRGSTGGGTKLIRNGTPGQLTDPLPLIRIESPHLEKSKLICLESRSMWYLTEDQCQQQR